MTNWVSSLSGQHTDFSNYLWVNTQFDKLFNESIKWSFVLIIQWRVVFNAVDVWFLTFDVLIVLIVPNSYLFDLYDVYLDGLKKVGENQKLGIHFPSKADMLLIGYVKCFGATN